MRKPMVFRTTMSRPVLHKALADIAKVDAAGSIATKVVVPIPAVVGLTSSIGASCGPRTRRSSAS